MDRHAAVPSQRRPHGPGAHADRRDQRAGRRIPSRPVWDEIRTAVQWVSPGPARWCRCCGAGRRIRGTPRLGIRFISAAPIAADMYRDDRAALPLPHRDDVRHDRSVPHRLQGGRRGGDRVPQVRSTQRSTCGSSTGGRPLPTGGVGEIACRARTSTCDERGVCVVGARRGGLRVEPHPEWFGTGDLGSLDDDGNLTYVDRVKDSLRRRGENISSVEVEQTVMGHPAVSEAAAVGIPSDLGEDDILVVVALSTGHDSGFR